MRINLYTMGSGMLRRTNVMVGVFSTGLMAASMKVIGKMIRPMLKVVSSMPMVIYTKASGSMTRHMDMEPIHTPMELDTRGIGKKISKTAWVKKHGLIQHVTRVNIDKVKSQELVNSNGPMAQNIKASSSKTIFMEKEPTFGVIKENTQVIGNITKWMGKVYSNGPMVGSIKDSIEMTRKMDMEFLNGKYDNLVLGAMVGNIKDIGIMVNNMAKVSSFRIKIPFGEKEFGMKVKGFDGQMTLQIHLLRIYYFDILSSHSL
jgi:hypothetical protein